MGTAELDAVVRRALRTHFVAGLDPPANYSVRLAATTSNTGAAPGSTSSTAARPRSSARATRSGSRPAWASTSPRSSPPPRGRLIVNGVALVGERGALIAPAALRQWMSAVERRLNVRGLRVVDAPWVLVDADNNEVVVPDPVAAGLGVDHDAFRALDDLAPSSRSDPAVAPGVIPCWAGRSPVTATR